MNDVVILSPLEQEYLLRVIEAGARVRDMRQFFLWTQGQLQALLPHQVMLCMEYGPGDSLRRLECLHGAVLGEPVQRQLADPVHGLAAQIARAGRDGWRMPAIAVAGQGGAPAAVQQRLEKSGFDNVLVNGSGVLAGGASVFALLGLPMKPGPRQAYFLELVHPHLHFALLRSSHKETPRAAQASVAAARPLSAREAEILSWVREGKSNFEIGSILGISALTVKNHLQRVYRALGVSNRAHALARCHALGLHDPGAAPLAPPRRA
ncbi:LuxR C-terminal-related transcriptional regulator [Massilia soli]|uniref:LuxR C-terminal-related transcriptional regulator n=1 Tax=Massilia soli TaxID=2792854 RepID=A0ABS7SKX9_9BURK|nr:LuxR C-terminal-related transcriptional regulator [Massilia soli]MBZ2206845.1 LuxR C-terminal-related transcriptional regulator [Massilia soli]